MYTALDVMTTSPAGIAAIAVLLGSVLGAQLGRPTIDPFEPDL